LRFVVFGYCVLLYLDFFKHNWHFLQTMTNEHASFCKVFFCCFLAVSLAGCASLKLPGGGNSAASSSGGAADEAKALNMTGKWSVGFKYNNETLNASMTLKQDGSTFQGTGKDEPAGTPFQIEQGQVRGDQVSFVKKYGGALAKVAPIQYAGSISTMTSEDYTGPYLKGDYTAKDGEGNPVSNDWDAVIDKPKPVAAAPQPAQAPEPAPAPEPVAPPPQAQGGETHPDKAPDLSGKWEVAYEYKFRTVKSIMFLEQEFDQVIGHGLDDNKEKFVFEKIFYKYPKITLIRKYQKTAPAAPVKGKGKGKDAAKDAGKAVGSERTMTFKGDVSVVNDADYQGPYIRGKTDGGGTWEAQRVK
jgi:hypothetical protein